MKLKSAIACGLVVASIAFERLESCRHCDVISTLIGDGVETAAIVSASHDDSTVISLFVGNGGEQAALVPTLHNDTSFHGEGERLAALLSTTVSSLLLKFFSVVIRVAACVLPFLYLFLTCSGIRSCRKSSNQSSNQSSNCTGSCSKVSKCNLYGIMKRRGGFKLSNECEGRSGRRKKKKSPCPTWDKEKAAKWNEYFRNRRRRRHCPRHTNKSEKKKKKQEKLSKKKSTIPPSSKRKAPPASAPNARTQAPASAAPTATTQASAAPPASPASTGRNWQESTNNTDGDGDDPTLTMTDDEIAANFDRLWDEASAHAAGCKEKNTTNSPATATASSVETPPAPTPTAPNASPEMQPPTPAAQTHAPTPAQVTESLCDWHRVFGITAYWMILRLVGSYSASFLAITVHVLGTMLLYKKRLLKRMVGRRIPFHFIVIICTCILSSFTQGLEIEDEDDDDENDDDGIYGSHFGQDHEWSSGQRYAFKIAINFCLQIAKELFNTNQLFVPNGHWWSIAGAFVLDNLAQLGDTNRSVIYTVGTTVATKVGHTSKGKVRMQLGYQNVIQKIFVAFNIDHQRGGDHKKLVNSIIKFCKEFSKGITPSNLAAMTIEQAIVLEASGLPFFASVFFYSIAHSAEECDILGGGRAIKGYLRRMLLFVTESGVQSLFSQLGIQLDASTMPHEFITGYGLLNWVKDSHEKCVKCGEAFFKKLDETFGNLDSSTDDRVNVEGKFIEYVLKKCIRMKALSSWKPGIKCVPLTAVILNLIFNIDRWTDAFGNRKTNPNDPYNPSKSYDDDDRDYAFRNFEAFLKEIESMFASFAALDTNFEMLKAPLARARSLATILKERDWKLFFSFKEFGLDIEVYFYQKAAGMWPSFIFIHGPPCYAFNTESSTLSSWEMGSMRQRAVELHLLFLFNRRFLAKIMTDGFNVSTDLAKYTVLYSILMAHAMFQYLVANFHLGTKTACLFSKNMIVSFNAFLEETRGYVNGLYSENCNGGLVSCAARKELTRTSANIRDRQFAQTVLNIFSRCFSKQCLVAGLKVLTVNEGFSLAVDVLKKDHNRWSRFVEKNLIGSELRTGLTNVWNRARGGSVGVREDKKEATHALMKDVEGWPETFPKGLMWNSKNENWNLNKTIFKSCKIDVTFPDTMQGLLDALNGLNRFNAMKALMKNVIKQATSEQLKKIKKVMVKHVRVKDGNNCDCEWCEEASKPNTKKRKSTASKKKPATKKHSTK